MQNLARFLQRHAGLLGNALWINSPDDFPFASSGLPGAGLFCQDYAAWRRLDHAGVSAEFDDFPSATGAPYDDILLCLPREKARLRMMVDCCAARLSPRGRLWLAGEKRAGIRSSPDVLGSCFGQIDKVDSARHCGLFRATEPIPGGAFDPDRWRQRWPLDWRGTALEIHSWPGVFGHGALDAGTALLLESMPDPAPGSRVLDMGCGAGVIGAALLATHAGLELTLADSYALACRSSRESLAANGLDGAVVASDGFSAIEGRFDLIVTNPPFHRGVRSDASMSPALLAPAGNFLSPGGQLILVANRHLPYRRWLDRTFGTTRTLAEDNRFHVLACRIQSTFMTPGDFP